LRDGRAVRFRIGNGPKKVPAAAVELRDRGWPIDFGIRGF
jgi:hypothetical protein